MAQRRKRSAPRTFVVIVQDKSGSMSSRTAATISGFNEYKNTLRREAEGDVLLTLTQFDTRVHRIHAGVHISDVPDLNQGSYVPGGMTALLDAVGQSVRDTEQVTRRNDRILVVVMTDGQENSSREWDHDSILKLFESKRADGWEFVFLGAGEEAWATGQLMGFKKTNSINYGTADAYDHQMSYRAMAVSTSDYTRGTPLAASLDSNTLKQDLETKAATETHTATTKVAFVPVDPLDPDPKADKPS